MIWLMNVNVMLIVHDAGYAVPVFQIVTVPMAIRKEFWYDIYDLVSMFYDFIWISEKKIITCRLRKCLKSLKWKALK